MESVALKLCYNKGVKEKEDLIIDVRSGSIGLAVLTYSPSGPQITFCNRKSLALQKSFEPSRLIGQMGTELKQFLNEFYDKKKSFRPHKIHVVVGSPWYLSQTRSVVHKSPTIIEYDEKIVRKLFQDEEEEFRTHNFGNRKPETIEREMLAVTLNGYPTSKPFGRKGSEIGISFYLSMIDTDFLEVIKNAINSIWRADQIYHTFPFLALMSTREMVDKTSNSYILLDIGGEVSELSLIRNSVALEGFSFPLGAHSIVREIATTFKLSLLEASSIYRAYVLKQVDKKIEAQIEKVLGDIKIKWSTYLHGMLEKISTLYVLPSVIIAIGNPETSHIFKDVVADESIAKLFTNQKAASIIALDSESIPNRAKVVPGAGILDVFLAIETTAIINMGKA